MDGTTAPRAAPIGDVGDLRLLGGLEALALLPLLQAERDRAAGLRTGGFISGYRGSPLGGYDRALEAVADALVQADVVFTPGLNEDLAATAVWGSQQVGLVEPGRVQGVFGLWYGKGPGVDRSGDALKHANQAGVSPFGGVVALAGDDHTAKSSSVAFQSEPSLIAAGIPILYPAHVGELIAYGLHGFAMSRYSGAWSALKCLVDIVETTQTIRLTRTIDIRTPTGPDEGGRHIRWPDDALGAERRLWDLKLPAARAYGALNGLDRVTHGAPRPKTLGIMASGRAWVEVGEWLRGSGLTQAALARAGVSILKIGMVWPMTDIPIGWAAGAREILVVEDKAPILEDQLRSALYSLAADRRPDVSGKRDLDGCPLLPPHGQIDAATLALALTSRLAARTSLKPRALVPVKEPAGKASGRPPWFCAGCPHNGSTRVPEGSRAGGGIGCHSMALWMGRGTALITHMGGEGANWIGQAPFTSRPHVFQNLGDGTYAHSGSLAIRAAVAADVNITFKILYNDAVAMTGGQFVEGHPSPWRVAEQVLAEGVCKLVVISEERHRYGPEARWPAGVQVTGREQLDRVQRELRDTPGVTVLLYDQTCAAEKRRRRRKGEYPSSPVRVVINEAVCEGCGDCGVQSNCVAIVPVETPLGRKRRVLQSECNQDLSCLQGFCPSFVTVEAARTRSVAAAPEIDLVGIPDPPPAPIGEAYRVLIAGIGGTGVVTAARLLGEAARQSGLAFAVLDQTGLAQKNGSVTSHLCFSSGEAGPMSAKAPPGGLDLLIACDAVTACDAQTASGLSRGRSRIIVERTVQPLAATVIARDLAIDGEGLIARLADRVEGPDLLAVSASTAVEGLGEAALGNAYLLGAAAQRGWLPLPVAAIEAAIRANGVAIERNLQAFRLGRWDVASGAAEPARTPQTLEDLIEHRRSLLAAYQDEAYARRYVAAVTETRAAESLPGGEAFVEAVARNLCKLMAYKDEYEVARLQSDPAFAADLRRRFGEGVRITHHLAPPMLGADGPEGRPRKRAFGPWIRPVLRILAEGRRLRGGPLDPFGYTAERRLERALIERYLRGVRAALATLSAETLNDAVKLASLPEGVRGFGPVKLASLAEVEAEWSDLERRFGMGELHG